MKAIPSDEPLVYHINRVLAWIANFIDVARFAIASSSSPIVVLAHTPQFGIGAALAKVFFPKRLRFVRVIGNEPSISLLVRRSRWRFNLEQKLERFVLRRADVVLPMGSYTYDLSIAYGVDPESCCAAISGNVAKLFQDYRFARTADRTFLRASHKREGRSHSSPSYEMVRQRVSDARLVIVGDANNKTYRYEFDELVDSLGIRDSVSFLGWIPNDAIGTIYQESWMLVIPSIWEEGLGMVMAEAGLMGRAVIGSQLGGISDFVIDGKNGFLVPPGDIEKLTAAITEMLESRARAVEMGHQNSVMARRYLEDFDRSVLQAQRAIYQVPVTGQ